MGLYATFNMILAYNTLTFHSALLVSPSSSNPTFCVYGACHNYLGVKNLELLVSTASHLWQSKSSRCFRLLIWQHIVFNLIASVTKLRNDSLQFAEGYMCCTVCGEWIIVTIFSVNVVFREERRRERRAVLFFCFNCRSCYYLQELAGTFSPVMSL